MLGRLGPVLALSAVGGGALLLVLWASMAGPMSVSAHDPSRLPLPTRPAVSSSPTPAPSASPSPVPTRTAGGQRAGWVGELAEVGVLIGVGVLVLWLWRQWSATAGRRRRTVRGRVAVSTEGAELDASLDTEPDREAIRAGLAQRYAEQVAALTELPPRNGIVQSWVLFEEAAAHAGVARARTETTTEFVVRLLHLLDIDPAAVGRLRALYVEARFSSHAVDVAQRDQARRALDAIHRDLDLAVPAASPSGTSA